LTVYREKYPLLRGFELLLHRRTHGLIGNSRAVLDQLATEVSDLRKIALIHNGIDMPPPTTAADRERVRQLLDIPKDALMITVIANLVSYKGHRDLLDALALVKEQMSKQQMSKEQIPKPWLVLAIGRDDGMGVELKRHAAALNLASNVRWLGEQPAADQLLAAGDIFILPSHQEGFSNALLEAMAANLAVIATAVGGNLDAIVDNESGILVPPRDPSALATAIARFASDPDIRRRYGDAARRRVEQRFALQRCVERYEKLYRAMSEPDPRPVAEILADDTGVSARRPQVPQYAR
jgi:glycosyltransferase involved in cell wall biosynthesis